MPEARIGASLLKHGGTAIVYDIEVGHGPCARMIIGEHYLFQERAKA